MPSDAHGALSGLGAINGPKKHFWPVKIGYKWPSHAHQNWGKSGVLAIFYEIWT